MTTEQKEALMDLIFEYGRDREDYGCYPCKEYYNNYHNSLEAIEKFLDNL